MKKRTFSVEYGVLLINISVLGKFIIFVVNNRKYISCKLFILNQKLKC